MSLHLYSTTLRPGANPENAPPARGGGLGLTGRVEGGDDGQGRITTQMDWDGWEHRA